MSNDLSFKEALERQGETKVVRRNRSAIRSKLLLKSRGELPRPVAIARELMAHGVPLRKAHDIIDRLAAADSYALEVTADSKHTLAAGLDELGVDCAEIRRPQVSVKAVREQFGLSQSQFAARFGLGLRTIQNWEQDRHELDAATTVLLAVIRDCPDAVESVLTRDPRPADQPARGSKPKTAAV